LPAWTQTHAPTNINEVLVIHLPLAIFAVAAGWSRWLEVRFQAVNGTFRRGSGRSASSSSAVLLLNYSEA
jgi:hypothetical protein